jgi:hypothetical protein
MPHVIIEVIAKDTTKGYPIPMILTYGGITYKIDRVKDMTKCKSLKSNGEGYRYICEVAGKDMCLYFNQNKWRIQQD